MYIEEFDEKWSHVQIVLDQSPEAIQNYVSVRVKPALQSNMEAGSAGWTNNACESANHMLKQRAHWRQHTY